VLCSVRYFNRSFNNNKRFSSQINSRSTELTHSLQMLIVHIRRLRELAFLKLWLLSLQNAHTFHETMLLYRCSSESLTKIFCPMYNLTKEMELPMGLLYPKCKDTILYQSLSGPTCYCNNHSLASKSLCLLLVVGLALWTCVILLLLPFNLTSLVIKTLKCLQYRLAIKQPHLFQMVLLW
jgi:hypothetical protein